MGYNRYHFQTTKQTEQPTHNKPPMQAGGDLVERLRFICNLDECNQKHKTTWSRPLHGGRTLAGIKIWIWKIFYYVNIVEIKRRI